MVEKVTETVEVAKVKLDVKFTEKFYDQVLRSKKQVAEKRGYDVDIGQYIEEAMNDLVKIIDSLSRENQLLNGENQSLFNQLNEPGAEHTEILQKEPEHMYG